MTSIKKPKLVVKTTTLNIQNWLQNTLQSIENKIANEASQIMQKSKAKALSHGSTNYKALSRSMDDLKSEELQIREKLRQIKLLEKGMKHSRSLVNHQPTVKSNAQLKQLTLKYRKFKQSLVEKTKIIEREQQEAKQKQKKLKEELKTIDCKERRKKVEEALKQLEKRKIERQEQHLREKQKLKELKKQTLFQKMKQDYNKKVNQSYEVKKSIYQNRHKEYSVDISSLSQYQKQYDQQKMQKDQKRTIKIAESRIHLPPICQYKSKHFDRIVEQQKQKAKRIKEEQQRGKVMLKKQKQFDKYVKKQFAPPIKPQGEESETEETEKQKKVGLEYEQMKQLGNEYFKSAKKYIASQQQRDQIRQKKMLSEQKENQIKPYTNYLKQLKLNNPKKHSKKYVPELKKLKEIMDSQNIKSTQKIENIKSFIKNMPYSFQPNNQVQEDDILKTISAKIKIIQMLH